MTHNEPASAGASKPDHQPREWLHVIDPPTLIANGARRDFVIYACQCGACHKVSTNTYLKRAA
jgi:hypothetical protein